MNKLLLIIFLFTFGNTFSQNTVSIVEKNLQERGEVYLSFKIADVVSNKKLFARFSFDKTAKDRVYFYANSDNYKKLKSIELNYKLEPIPSEKYEVAMAKNVVALSYSWNKYPTYQQYDSLMHKFEIDFPDKCKLLNLGTLASGRKILVVKLGDSVNVDNNKVKFLYTSSMHGDEITGYVLMLRLIDYLLTNYNTNSYVKYLMDNIEIWINPLANPDGTYHNGNNTVFGATRYNANAVDLNRNYPDPEDGPHPDGKVYQRETEIFMNLADSIQFTMSANLHGGSEVVNYPWDTWSKLSADDDWWKIVSKRFADTAQANSPNGYMEKFGTGYTNGYQWYSVWGGRQDYMNYFQQCREVTIEISKSKTISESMLNAHWNYLYPSFLNYMKEVTFGFSGQVTDSLTGYAVKSKIEILNHDIDSSLVFSNDSGYYFRPINTGTYDIKYSADGYYPKTLYNISVQKDSLVKLDVQLLYGYNSIQNIDNLIDVKIFPNPVDGGNVSIVSDKKIKRVEVCDLFGKIVFHQNFYNQSIELNLMNLSKGIYFVNIIHGNNRLTKKLIIK